MQLTSSTGIVPEPDPLVPLEWELVGQVEGSVGFFVEGGAPEVWLRLREVRDGKTGGYSLVVPIPFGTKTQAEEAVGILTTACENFNAALARVRDIAAEPARDHEHTPALRRFSRSKRPSLFCEECGMALEAVAA